MLIKKISILLILILVGTNGSCFWFRSPEEMTADAEEEIHQSEALQNLEKLCINLPFFNKLKPREKMVIRQRTLSYDYRLDKNFNDLKAVYKNKFLSEGWTLTNETRLVAEESIKFEKGKLEVNISKSLFDEKDYTISCTDGSIAD
jgi:hypothetical protein